MSPPLPKTVKTALGILGGAALTSACACLNYAPEPVEETGEDDTGESGDEQAKASDAVIDRGVLPNDIAEILRTRSKS